jgi:hypothetical protein
MAYIVPEVSAGGVVNVNVYSASVVVNADDAIAADDASADPVGSPPLVA